MRQAARTLGGLAVVAFVAGILGTVGGPRPVLAAAYDRFYANFQGEELMRAMNADRAAVGLSNLAPDPVLERIARDRPLVCPSNAALTIRGRARDMADRGYLSHSIPGCNDSTGGAFDGFDLLKAFGYTYAAAGENISDNTYPSTALTYATGCGLTGSSCNGSTTLPSSVAATERFFMSSSAHRAAILSTTYDHFGCGAWDASNGTHYFACYFTDGGNGSIDGTGPAITAMTGDGATFPAGSTPTFGATATDSQSLLSDGYAAIDGVHIANWADDHAGSSESLSVKAPPVVAGAHTFTWWVRDASSQARSASFAFTVSGQAQPTPSPQPTSTPKATPRPTPTPTSRPTSGPPAGPTATPVVAPGSSSTTRPPTQATPGQGQTGASGSPEAGSTTPSPDGTAPTVAPSAEPGSSVGLADASAGLFGGAWAIVIGGLAALATAIAAIARRRRQGSRIR